MDREAWHAAVHGVAKSRTWLSHWTEMNWHTHLGLFCFLDRLTLLLLQNVLLYLWWYLVLKSSLIFTWPFLSSYVFCLFFLVCFILSLIFNWRIIVLQCCVGFCCIMWTSRKYMYPPVCFLLNLLVFKEPPYCFHSGCTSFHSHPQSKHIILRGLFSRSSKPIYSFSWDGSAQEQMPLSSFRGFSFSTPPFTIALFSCFNTKQQTSQPPVSYCGAKKRDTCTPTLKYFSFNVCLLRNWQRMHFFWEESLRCWKTGHWAEMLEAELLYGHLLNLITLPTSLL